MHLHSASGCRDPVDLERYEKNILGDQTKICEDFFDININSSKQSA